ncbi:MAG: DnaJ domain-containing protein [Pseudomonadota bacterium]
MKDKTYYDMLGLTPAAPPEIVSAVYRAWMKALKVHPDLGGDEEFARQINEAYDTLKDPQRRAEYDTKLVNIVPGKYETARRAPRVKIDAQIAYCDSLKSQWAIAKVMDASALGLRIRAEEPLEAGQHLAIAFSESCAMAAEAEVRWANHLKNNDRFCFEAGIEFYSPIPDILLRLK